MRVQLALLDPLDRKVNRLECVGCTYQCNCNLTISSRYFALSNSKEDGSGLTLADLLIIDSTSKVILIDPERTYTTCEEFSKDIINLVVHLTEFYADNASIFLFHSGVFF